jgi:hypothetical protein
LVELNIKKGRAISDILARRGHAFGDPVGVLEDLVQLALLLTEIDPAGSETCPIGHCFKKVVPGRWPG